MNLPVDFFITSLKRSITTVVEEIKSVVQEIGEFNNRGKTILRALFFINFRLSGFCC